MQTLCRQRILSVSPSATGFGFAVIDEFGVLVDWGAILIRGDKNKESLSRVTKLLASHRPQIVALGDVSDKTSKRGTRTRKCIQQIARFVSKQQIKVTFVSNEIVVQRFCGEKKATKYEIAKMILEQLPELTGWLPAKRRPWENAKPKMDIFDAAAMGLSARSKNIKRSNLTCL